MPNAAEMAVPACPAPKMSCGLSTRLQEARQPALLPQRRQAVVAARQDLPRVALVAHVPHDLVARTLEHVEQRHRELDHAEPGPDVPAGLGDDLDQPLADLLGELRELVRLQVPEVVGAGDGIEQGHGCRSGRRLRSSLDDEAREVCEKRGI
jgi:hypothetical protein